MAKGYAVILLDVHDADRYADYADYAERATSIEARYGGRPLVISRPDGDRTEFLTISFWDGRDSIVAFAGDDIARAVFYPEDDRYLIDRETTVKHFTVH